MTNGKGVFNKRVELEIVKALENGEFSGKCYCGCGGNTELATRTRTDRNFNRVCFAGYPKRYIKGHEPQLKKGRDSPYFKEGRRTDVEGYVWIYEPDHWLARKDGYVREHILIMENHLGRKLKRTNGKHCIASDEVVHHKDFNKSNNDIDNLKLMSHADHVGLHRRLK